LIEKYVFNQDFIVKIVTEVESKLSIGFFMFSDLEDNAMIPSGFSQEPESVQKMV